MSGEKYAKFSVFHEKTQKKFKVKILRRPKKIRNLRPISIENWLRGQDISQKYITWVFKSCPIAFGMRQKKN